MRPRRELEGNTASAYAARTGGAAKVSGLVEDHSCIGSASIVARGERVDHRLRTGRSQFVYHSAAVQSTARRVP